MFEKLRNIFLDKKDTDKEEAPKSTDNCHFNEPTVEDFLLDTNSIKLGISNLSSSIKQSRDWIPYLSLTISLIIALTVSDFKPINGFTAEMIQGVFIALTGVFVVLTGISLVNCARLLTKTDEKYVIEYFKKQSKMPIEYRILCIIKSNQIVDSHNRLLFYNDEIWDCFFLPHFRTGKNISVDDLTDQISSTFCIEKEKISVELYDNEFNKTSEKPSSYHRRVTLYHSKFCYVKISDAPAGMNAKTFTINSRKFEWQTLTEAMNDTKQKNMNSDILRHLEDFANIFINKSHNSVTFASRRANDEKNS